MRTLLLFLIACDPAPTLSTAPPADGPAPTQAEAPADAHAGHDGHGGHDGPPQADAPQPDPPGTPVEAAAPALELVLNGTEKWPMEAHTRAAMVGIRDRLSAATVESTSEAAQLADQLDSDLNGLIGGCTMGGEAHDQLHVFLTAFQPAINGLRMAADGRAAGAQVETLQRMVHQYDAHFE